MSTDVDAAIARIRKMEDAGDALVASYKEQNKLYRDAAGDKAKVLALADEGDAKAAQWAQAVTDGTDVPPLVTA